MTHVLLVDDEMSFLTYLKTLLNWGEYGYEIVGVAPNGVKALEMLQALPVDVVLTDMRMPVMDGAQLIERCQHLRGKVAFVALSGFKDFEYVHQSLRAGAVDYLLKYSLTAEGLLETLEKARARIHQAETTEEAALFARYQADLAMQALTSALHAGNEDEMQLTGALEQFSIDPLNYVVFLICIDHYGEALEKLKTERQQQRCLRAVQEMCQNVVEDVGQGVVVRDEASGRYMLLCSFEDTKSYLYLRALTQQIASRISNTLKRMLNLSCTIVISGPVSGGAGLEPCIDRLDAMAQLRFYKGSGHVFYEQDERRLREVEPRHPAEERLRALLQRHDREGIADELRAAFRWFEENLAQRQGVEGYCLEFYHVVSTFLKSNGIAVDGEAPFVWMRRLESAEGLCKGLLAFCEEGVQRLAKLSFPPEYSEVTQKALRRIATGYAGDLSLESVAREMGMSSAYVSRMFKKDVQKGFVEYLNHYRITMACEMILRDAPLKEVAQKCGFANYNYFFKVFREQKGMTPQEYRKIKGE